MAVNDIAVQPEIVRILVENHRRLTALLQGRMGGSKTASRILRQTLAREIGRAGMLRDDESAVAWLSRSLRNAVKNFHRRHVSQEGVFARLAVESQVASIVDSPELRAAIASCVSDLATTLKPELATILQRVEIEGASVPDVAREEGIANNDAAHRLYWAREELRFRVFQLCGVCVEHSSMDCCYYEKAV